MCDDRGRRKKYAHFICYMHPYAEMTPSDGRDERMRALRMMNEPQLYKYYLNIQYVIYMYKAKFGLKFNICV